jgi:hypothetical protein
VAIIEVDPPEVRVADGVDVNRGTVVVLTDAVQVLLVASIPHAVLTDP